MKYRLLALLPLLMTGAALAQGPAAPESPTPAAPPTTPIQGEPPGPDVRYVCPGGPDFSAVFSSDGELATLMVPGQPEIELTRQRSGSGFAYGDSYFELRGRGREATLTAAGRTMRCHAAGRPGEPPRTFEGPNLTVTLFPDGTFRLRERRDGVAEPVLELGQWTQEVDGGVRLILRSGAVARRAFRQADEGRLVAESGTVLMRAATFDKIDGRFRLDGLYRDSQSGGLFTECSTGRTFGVAPGGAEPDLERTWTEVAPSREAQVFLQVLGRFSGDGEIEVESLLGIKPTATCPPLAPRSATLRGTEWRVVEIGGERVAFADGRRQPRVTLEDNGTFTTLTGCTSLSGNYELDPDGLRFIAGPPTTTDCPPPTDTVQQRFIDALGAVKSARITATTLDLMDANGKRLLRLEARGR